MLVIQAIIRIAINISMAIRKKINSFVLSKNKAIKYNNNMIAPTTIMRISKYFIMSPLQAKYNINRLSIKVEFCKKINVLFHTFVGLDVSDLSIMIIVEKVYRRRRRI